MLAFDYSLSCPCLCIASKPGIENCKFYFLTNVVKYVGVFENGQITGTKHTGFLSPEERYENISCFFLDIEERQSEEPVVFEDYSFGSKGRVFQIAENAGLMKWKLWAEGHDITAVPPTVIKKFATGSGAAKKDQMYKAFKTATGRNLNYLNTKTKIDSPLSDIVDSYWLAQYAFTLIEK